jgi:Protein of unknown function (DUF3326)
MFAVVHLIPTGVGAAIGGFAGDATPVAHLLASVSDRLVTHPNALNAANLFSKPANAWYVEGGMLDRWLSGDGALRSVRAHRIGILVDRAVEAMPEGTMAAVLNAANAVRAVYGVEIVGYHMTDRPLGCRIHVAPSGVSSGSVADPQALLDGGRHLLARGATAIAVLADLGQLPPESEAAYQAGTGVDPIGGLEAILSHLLVDELGVPAAHAPLMPFEPEPPPVVDPRAAAEYLGHNYLPCILQGLCGHPVRVAGTTRPGDMTADEVAAVVVPAGCLGGPGVLAAHARGIPLIAVRENATVQAVTASALGLGHGVVEVANYLEAAGVLAAMRAGLDWRACRRPLLALEPL